MKPLEVWTCQRAENLKNKSSKIPKNNYAATMVSAARRQIIGGGGGPRNQKRRRGRPGRRTALVPKGWPATLMAKMRVFGKVGSRVRQGCLLSSLLLTSI